MKKVLVWGTGFIANRVFQQCQTLDQYEIIGAVDSDKEKWGGLFYGMTIVSPDSLPEIETDVIAILTDKYDEIKHQIECLCPDVMPAIENKNFFYKESILHRYRNNNDPEIRKILEHIKNNGLDVFNYSFTAKYKARKNQIWKDDANGLYFVLHNGKKMYFPRKFKSEKEVNDYYNAISMEQDERSPHRYLSGEYCIKEGDVVLDVGVAEGNFALDVIDKASHVYLLEAEEGWMEALRYTFKDYIDKVTFIHGYVGSYNEGKNITLDAVITAPVNFIKMDIEGNEWDALRGATELINKSNDLKMAICSYHSDFDKELIESFMDKNRISHTYNQGYIWFPETVRQTYVSTSLNRAVIKGIKNK